MNDTQITVTGWVGSPVELREAAGVAVTDFRVACTPRRFDRKSQEWVNGDTQWYNVTAWRQLAENCAASLNSGDPVVLHGRMVAETWKNNSGMEMTTMKVEASFVGHDLTRGVSRFARNPKPDGERAESVQDVRDQSQSAESSEPSESSAAA